MSSSVTERERCASAAKRSDVIHAAQRHECGDGLALRHEQRIEPAAERRHGAGLRKRQRRQRACTLDVGEKRCQGVGPERRAQQRRVELGAQRRGVRQLRSPSQLHGAGRNVARGVVIGGDRPGGDRALELGLERLEGFERSVGRRRLDDEQMARVGDPKLGAQRAIALEQIRRHRRQRAQVVLPERLRRQRYRACAHGDERGRRPQWPRQPTDRSPEPHEHGRLAIVARPLRHDARQRIARRQAGNREPGHRETRKLLEVP